MNGVDSWGEFIPPSRLQAKRAERTERQHQQALVMAQEFNSTIETYLDRLKKLSDADRQQILRALAPVTRVVPLLEEEMIELVQAEMMDETASDYDAETPNNVPRGRELADWKEALALGESLLPIDDFDFSATHAQFLVTIETDPERTVTPINGVVAHELKKTQYVRHQYMLAEKFFLICLRMLRFQYRFGTSQEVLLENARPDLAQG